MAILPTEVLGLVFLQLHQTEKVECMLVCREWKQIIEKFALFHTVVIRNHSGMDKLIARIQGNPGIAAKVRELMIYSDSDVFFDEKLDDFTSLFPNLQVLIPLLDFFELKNITPIKQWCRSIRHVEDDRNRYAFAEELCFSVLSMGVCSNLSILSMDFKWHTRGTTQETRQAERYIAFSLLKNAPALKKLTLSGADLNFNDLNAIHANAPKLKLLSLKPDSFSDMGFDENIQDPATALVRFSFAISGGRNMLIYISKKYPSISNLDINVSTVNLMNEPRELIIDGLNTLFYNLGSQLKKLCITTIGNGVPFFEALGRSEYRIHHLRIAVDVSEVPEKHARIQPQYAHYIQTITMSGVPYQTYEWLRGCETLEELIIYGKDDSNIVKLNDLLLNSPPTLRTMSFLRCRTLNFDKDFTSTFNLTRLSLHRVTLLEKLDRFINQCLPNLSDLGIFYCSLKGEIWDLSSVDLIIFRFTDFLERAKCNVLIKSNSESRMYSLRIESYDCDNITPPYLYEYPYTSCPANESNAIPIFTLCCNSLTNIKFV